MCVCVKNRGERRGIVQMSRDVATWLGFWKEKKQERKLVPHRG